MNVNELFDATGTAVGLWRCGVCGMPSGSRRAAEACCRCRSCGTACEAGERIHAACRERERQETLAAAVADRPPGPLADLDGHVYLPAWNATHRSVAAVQRMLVRAEIPAEEWPSYGYLCNRRPFVIDVDEALHIARSGHEVEILDRIDPAAIAELRAAVARFNETVRSQAFSLTPDLYRKVAIPRPSDAPESHAGEHYEGFRITPAARAILAGVSDDLRAEVLQLAAATRRRLRQTHGGGDVIDADDVHACRNIVLTTRDIEREDAEFAGDVPTGEEIARFQEAVELVAARGASILLSPPWGPRSRHDVYGTFGAVFALRAAHVPQLLTAPETFWATVYYGVDVEQLREWRAWSLGRDGHRCTGWTKSGRRCRAYAKFTADEDYPAGFRSGVTDRCVAHRV